MSEKKTFKVDNRSLGRDYNDFGWIVSGIETVVSEGVNHFDDDEWDMEVTFTKKVRPEVGGTANLAIGGPYYTVIAVSGDRVWLQDTNDEYVNFVRRFDQLVDVKPWQPA